MSLIQSMPKKCYKKIDKYVEVYLLKRAKDRAFENRIFLIRLFDFLWYIHKYCTMDILTNKISFFKGREKKSHNSLKAQMYSQKRGDENFVFSFSFRILYSKVKLNCKSMFQKKTFYKCLSLSDC